MDLQLFASTQVIVFIITFVLTLIAGALIIPVLKRLKFGQTVRDDGPATHLKKMGIPTMGGLIFLIPMILVASYFSADYPEMLPMLLATVGFALIGFIDDFIKVVRKNKDGLSAKQKSLGQLTVGTAFSFYVAYSPNLGTGIIIPFRGMDSLIGIPAWIFIPVVTLFIMYFFTNSVNLTDGVDGLAAGVTLIVAVFFAIVAMTRSEWDFVKVFSSIAAGGCLGFLAFNIHPAKVIMGDTGSLALGGVVTTAAVIMKMPWILVIAGGIYFIEGLSVIMQVASFKLTGKRIFRMSPIHHHFELSGWKETKVVKVFWIATAVFCLIGFIALRFNVF
ncbi:MAG: phospho-N-acetylmuramoyl-pentapeptide-transferase [Ruminiclostridium sp.]|nr:phospho-N-acetylmuramoyl-pentapeptide-transferase [Ruminiclostridium sp.]